MLKDSSFEVFKHILASEQVTIKYLVNAAGIGLFGDSNLNLSLVNEMIDLNVKALVNMTYLSIPYMSKGSHIIQLGSAASFTPLVNLSIYSSTKAFVLHFSNALYLELKSKGIHVTVVCPGWVKTEFLQNSNLENSAHAPRTFRPMYKSKDVVKKAIKDSENQKMISIPGVLIKIYYMKSKFAPKKCAMNLWKLIQK